MKATVRGVVADFRRAFPRGLAIPAALRGPTGRYRLPRTRCPRGARTWGLHAETAHPEDEDDTRPDARN